MQSIALKMAPIVSDYSTSIANKFKFSFKLNTKHVGFHSFFYKHNAKNK